MTFLVCDLNLRGLGCASAANRSTSHILEAAIPFSIDYDPENHLILFVAFDRVEPEEARRAANEFAAMAKKHDCFRALADLRKLVWSFSTFDIYRQPGVSAEAAEAQGFSAGKYKRALLVDDNMEDAMFYETVANNHGQSVKIFTSLEAAKAWLLNDGG